MSNPIRDPLLVDDASGVPRLALRAREAAKALGVSERLLFDLVRDGLPVVRLRRARLFPTNELRAWLSAQAARQAGNPTEESR